MTILTYYKQNAPAYPDSQAEYQAKQLLHCDVVTSTDNVVWWALCMIAEGTITDVEVYFEDEKVNFSEHGEIINYPVGFLDMPGNLSMRIVKACLANRKASRQ